MYFPYIYIIFEIKKLFEFSLQIKIISYLLLLYYSTITRETMQTLSQYITKMNQTITKMNITMTTINQQITQMKQQITEIRQQMTQIKQQMNHIRDNKLQIVESSELRQTTFHQQYKNKPQVQKGLKSKQQKVLIESDVVQQQQIFNNIIQNNKTKKLFGYLKKIQTSINEEMRQELLDWLIKIHLDYKFQTQTLFLTVQIIDTYLSVTRIDSKNFSLLGLTALWIAGKFQQKRSTLKPKCTDLVKHFSSKFSKEQFTLMENLILVQIQYNIITYTSYNFLEQFGQSTEFQQKDYFLARYLIQMSLLSYQILKYSNRCVAAASIFVINRLRKKNRVLNKILKQKINCSYKQKHVLNKQSISTSMKSIKIKIMKIQKSNFLQANIYKLEKQK